MDQNQNSPLFGLTIDQSSKNHLAEAARWAKFLAIVGFVVCGLIVLGGIFFSSFFATMGGSRYGDYDNDAISGAVGLMAGVYVFIGVIYFIPCLFLYYFATKMKAALLSDDQNVLNTSFQNLKKMFRFVGIITLIMLSLYALGLIVTIIGGVASQV